MGKNCDKQSGSVRCKVEHRKMEYKTANETEYQVEHRVANVKWERSIKRRPKGKSELKA